MNNTINKENKVEKKLRGNKDMDWELSYYTNAIPYRDDQHIFRESEIRESWEILKKAGIDWVGFHGVNLFEKSEPDFSTVIPLVADMLDEFGFQVSSLHYGGHVYSLENKDQEFVRKKLLEYVDRFSAWTPKSLVIHAGWAPYPKRGDTSIEEYCRLVSELGFDTITSIIADNLKLMAQAAAKYDIKLALENMGKFLPLGQEYSLPPLVKMIDEPNVGYCLDSGHAHACGESITEWIEIMGNRLFETHFHDNRALGKGKKDEFIDISADEHLSPGFGTISWIDVIQALQQMSFPGPVTFETEGWPMGNSVKGYKLSIEWWRTCEKQVENLKFNEPEE